MHGKYLLNFGAVDEACTVCDSSGAGGIWKRAWLTIDTEEKTEEPMEAL
jgi:hypothetical protein